MKIIKKESKLLSDKRDVVESLYKGDTCYQVLFKQTYQEDWYIFGKLISSQVKKIEELDNIIFGELSAAEWYARNARHICDTHLSYTTEYQDHIIYLIGDEMIHKYGYFTIDCVDRGPIKNGSFYIKFCFNSKYQNTYCKSLMVNDCITKYYDDFTADKCISYILNKCNNFEKFKKVVSSYDVISMKTISIDQLNANSKELAELRQLVEQFHKDQEAYSELLKKLMSK